jgi:hypothetical protein
MSDLNNCGAGTAILPADNIMTKRKRTTKGQNIHIKLKIEQHEPH